MVNEIWSYHRGYYKFYTEDKKLFNKIKRWKDSEPSAIYSSKGIVFGWDIIIPARYYNRAAKLAKLPLKRKNKNRVAAGKKRAGILKKSA